MFFFEISEIEISDVSLVHLFHVFHLKRHVLVPFFLVKFGGVDHRSFKVAASLWFLSVTYACATVQLVDGKIESHVPSPK